MIDILLVDDEPRMLELLTLYLTPIGYNCVCATSGEEAILHIENRNFKFVFTRYYDAKDGRMGNVQKNPIF